MLADVTAAHYIAISGVATSVVLTVLGWFLKRMDDRNTRQHAEAQASRDKTDKKIDATHNLLVQHLVDHAHTAPLRLVKES